MSCIGDYQSVKENIELLPTLFYQSTPISLSILDSTSGVTQESGSGSQHITWAIWNYRNRASCENKLIKTPFEIVFAACISLASWAGIQKGGDADALKKGAELLRTNAVVLMKACQEAGDSTVIRGWWSWLCILGCWSLSVSFDSLAVILAMLLCFGPVGRAVLVSSDFCPIVDVSTASVL